MAQRGFPERLGCLAQKATMGMLVRREIVVIEAFPVLPDDQASPDWTVSPE